MTTENNKKVVREFYEEVFQKHNLNAVDRFMLDDYIQHNPDTAQGKKGFVDFHKGFFAAVPDFFSAINRMVAEGDLVFVYNTITGTHTGEGFLGYPPTGNKVHFDAVDMFRLRDGKLCEHWDVADTRALFSQVGAQKEFRILNSEVRSRKPEEKPRRKFGAHPRRRGARKGRRDDR